MIAMGGLECAPLTQALYEACIKAGALPQVQFLFGTDCGARCCVHGDAAPGKPGCRKSNLYGMDWADVYFGLRGGGALEAKWAAFPPRFCRPTKRR